MAATVDGVVYRAESYLAVGQHARAETLVREALAQHPDDVRLLVALMRVLEDQKRWSDVVATGHAALAVDPGQPRARLILAWAAYQLGDVDTMTEHTHALLAANPDHATAHMYVALAALAQRAPDRRERARHHYRLALEHSGGDPWFVLNAAFVESSLGRTSEARRLIEDGLTQHPQSRELLEARAKLGTPEESLEIVAGLLASDPGDTALQTTFRSVVSRQRRRYLSTLWVVPALLALVTAVSDGITRVLGVTLVLLVAVATGCARASTAEKLPPSVRAELAARTPWRSVTRGCSTVAALVGGAGGIALAAGSIVGAWFLVLATAAWVATRVSTLTHEVREARGIDAVAAAAAARSAPVPPVGPAMLTLSRERRGRALWTPVVLAPFALVALADSGSTLELAARSALGIIVGVVALNAVAEGIGWKRAAPVRWWLRTQYVVLASTTVVLLVLLLATSVGRLADATEEWSEQEYGRQLPDSPGVPRSRVVVPRPAPTPLDIDLPTIPPITVPDF